MKRSIHLTGLLVLLVSACSSSGSNNPVPPVPDGGGGTGGVGGAAGAGGSGGAGGAGGAGSEAGTTTAYEANLSGAQETPPTNGAFSGHLTLTLSADKTTIAYDLTHNVSDATLTHIHAGAAGEGGDAIIPFEPVSTHETGTASITADQVTLLERGQLYVNIHNPANPNGVIRGQILRPGEKVYVATLKGAEETPPVTTTSTGTASVIVDAIRANIRYHVKTTLANGAVATKAHVHSGLATISGPVAHEFMPIGPVIDGAVAITDADAADLEQGRWYANVHTAANPKGEIRGQLILPGEILYSAPLSPDSEVPPSAGSTASGGGEFILSPDLTTLRYEFAVIGMTATKAHIHTGTVGIPGPILYPLTLGGLGVKGTQPVVPVDVTALDAGGLYINVHSVAFPNGEIRGQIAKQ